MFGKFCKELACASSTKSCFKYGCECHYIFPWINCMKSCIEITGKEIDWYKWNGTHENIQIFTIIPKYQNTMLLQIHSVNQFQSCN